MNLRAVEDAFLEDLYDERQKIRVELPKAGFGFYVAPASNPKSIWYACLASEAVAEVYTKLPIRSADLARLAKAVHIRNATSESARRGRVGEMKDVRIVPQVEDARRIMIEYLVEWLGVNFGTESRHTAEQCARDALELVREQTSLGKALAQAECARRWFPTFYDVLRKEVARVAP